MSFIRQSKKCPRYFEFSDGKTFLPIGTNLCFVRNSEKFTEKEVLEIYRRWMTALAENSVNYIRVWLGVPFFDLMPERIGVYSEKNLGHVKALVAMAEELGVKIKFTLEHFRSILSEKQAESFSGIVPFGKEILKDKFSSVQEFLDSAEGREIYLAKARFLAAAVGNSPSVVAIELWNEINALGPMDVWADWSNYMLEQLHLVFPNQMVVQNLGSFWTSNHKILYSYLSQLEKNDFVQAHRYYDPASVNQLSICLADMDVLCADAVRELLYRNFSKPAVLAETGAVEYGHRCYSHYYELDTEGVILHDSLFAPFFAGSAGSGQPWHWDYIYIEKHNLYWHFSRFAKAVAGIDPADEEFYPEYYETQELRIYILRGKKHNLYWCRDKQFTWENELDKKIASRCCRNFNTGTLMLTDYQYYLPWADKTGTGTGNILPDFTRSVVLREKVAK
ncbi:MAG: hypothetical protein WCS73_01435 [Lentisphaeria bacterium]